MLDYELSNATSGALPNITGGTLPHMAHIAARLPQPDQMLSNAMGDGDFFSVGGMSANAFKVFDKDMVSEKDLEGLYSYVGAAYPPETLDALKKNISEISKKFSNGSVPIKPHGKLQERQITHWPIGFIPTMVIEHTLTEFLGIGPDLLIANILHTASIVLPILGLLIFLGALIPVVVAVAGKLKQGGNDADTIQSLVMITIGGFGSKVPSEKKGLGDVMVHPINQEGSVPHAKIFNEHGFVLGTSQGDKNGHLDYGRTKTLQIVHDKNDEAQRTLPSYLAVYMNENDAVCISEIKLLTPNAITYSWLGDIGYVCGAPWYFNSISANRQGYKPKCTWLDKDHKPRADLKYGAMAIHMPDFVATPERVLQYNVYPDTICKSTPRFQMYESFTDEDFHSVYDPPLKFANNMTDIKVKDVIGRKGKAKGHQPPFKHMESKFQPKPQMFGNQKQDPPKKKKKKPPHEKREKARIAYPTGKERELVSSDHEAHDIHLLCDPEGTSRGPDFISMQQSLFCDMGLMELWPLCDRDHGLEYACFDYATKTMRGPASGIGKRDEISGRDIPEKEYQFESVWRAGKEDERVLVTW